MAAYSVEGNSIAVYSTDYIVKPTKWNIVKQRLKGNKKLIKPSKGHQPLSSSKHSH